jgi:hypothetical protein
MTEAMSAASAIVSQNNGITTCAPLAALSSIVSAPANSIAWTRCLDGQTEEWTRRDYNVILQNPARDRS